MRRKARLDDTYGRTIRSFVFDPARRAVFSVLFRLGRAGGLYLVASLPLRGFLLSRFTQHFWRDIHTYQLA
jgi:hypothetical protein